MARSAARQAMEPKTFSVWEVLIPIIFILGYMRQKEQQEIFTQNLMFTKIKALEAAFKMLKKNKTKEAVLSEIDHETKELLAQVDKSIYSEDIRQCQIDEIKFLMDHYLKLLNVDASDYETLVISAYSTVKEYGMFIQNLKQMEDKVTLAAQQTLGDKTDTRTLSRLESAIDTARQKEADAIFNSTEDRGC